jgi:Glycosyl transferase family 2
MDDQTVTLIVTPRERFGMARESLLSIFAATRRRFDLIYVDCGVNAALSDWLDQQAGLRGFRILRPGMVAPNEARNLGLRLASTRYVVFIDNDVLVAPGWLDALLDCAHQEQADIVAPLTCQGLPSQQMIHQAGGSLLEDPEAFFAQPAGQRTIVDRHFLAGRRIADVAAQLHRSPIGACEFHCVLVRRTLFDWIGPLDERLLASREHLDLCLAATQAGKKIVFEPNAVVTYVFPNRFAPLSRADWRYFMLRWSPQWVDQSISHFEAKWGLRSDPSTRSSDVLSWRLIQGIAKPLTASIPGTARFMLWRLLCSAVLARACQYASRLQVHLDQRRRRLAHASARRHGTGTGNSSGSGSGKGDFAISH